MEQQAAPPPGDPTVGVSSDDETVNIPSSIEDPKKALQTIFEIEADGTSMVRIDDRFFGSSADGRILRIRAQEYANVVVAPDLEPRRGSGLFGNGQSIHSKESLTRYSAKLGVNKKVSHCR